MLLLGGAVLYQTTIRSDDPPTFSRGGNFAGGEPSSEGELDLSLSTPKPTPGPGGLVRSSAVITAPRSTPEPEFSGSGPPPAPVFGRYIYKVAGYEQATAFQRRSYPPEMTTTVHRDQPEEPGVPRLKSDELIMDLFFSAQHEEREIVAFRRDALMFTYEARSVTFGPSTQTSEATYDPPITQIPIPLDVGETREGTTRATTPEGEESRIEDWTMKVEGRETIQIMDERVDTWIVRIDRQTRPESSEQMTLSRTYWFAPERSMWVRWDEEMTTTQDFGPGTVTYDTKFSATLDRIEPL